MAILIAYTNYIDCLVPKNLEATWSRSQPPSAQISTYTDRQLVHSSCNSCKLTLDSARELFCPLFPWKGNKCFNRETAVLKQWVAGVIISYLPTQKVFCNRRLTATPRLFHVRLCSCSAERQPSLKHSSRFDPRTPNNANVCCVFADGCLKGGPGILKVRQ